MHVLIVDDSKTIRTILKVYLTKWGFEVTEAVNGRDGLDRLKEIAHTDLVLVDWNMPEMDGISFVRAVRAEPAYSDVPLMMVTTNAELDHVSTALDAGANEFIMKPFTGDVIRKKLEMLGILQA